MDWSADNCVINIYYLYDPSNKAFFNKQFWEKNGYNWHIKIHVFKGKTFLHSLYFVHHGIYILLVEILTHEN